MSGASKRAEPAQEFKPPWKMKPLDEWRIVGMNHYRIQGHDMLYVAMTKGGKCIQSEGLDDEYLWNRLWHSALEADESAKAGSTP